MKKRRALTLGQKVDILLRYCPCACGCGEIIGTKKRVRWDHTGARVFTRDDSKANHRPIIKACHDRKTFGPGGEKRITTYGGDIHAIAKTAALAKQHQETRRSILAPVKRRRRTVKRKSRPFPKGRGFSK